MKIAVIGAGAMGSVYVALLGAAGHDVWAIDSWAAHIDAIRTNGLRLEGASGDRTVTVQASTRAADAGVCDLVIIAACVTCMALVAMTVLHRPVASIRTVFVSSSAQKPKSCL